MGVTPVFIISLPRAGSTLLQRMLGSHPQIATASEPWILLPLLSVDRPGSAQTDYGFDLSRKALQDFWRLLPNGRAQYVRAVGKLAQSLYDAASPSERQRTSSIKRRAIT